MQDSSAEFYLPEAVSKAVDDEAMSVKVLPTEASWFGVTYKEDKEPTMQKIRNLVDRGDYPENLWR